MLIILHMNILKGSTAFFEQIRGKKLSSSKLAIIALLLHYT